MFKAVIFDVAGVLTEGLGAILLEAAAGIEGDLDQLAEALIPVFMGEGDSDVAGHRLERGEITLDFFLSSLGNVENCLLYTSPSPRDRQKSRMPSSA